MQNRRTPSQRVQRPDPEELEASRLGQEAIQEWLLLRWGVEERRAAWEGQAHDFSSPDASLDLGEGSAVG